MESKGLKFLGENLRLIFYLPKKSPISLLLEIKIKDYHITKISGNIWAVLSSVLHRLLTHMKVSKTFFTSSLKRKFLSPLLHHRRYSLTHFSNYYMESRGLNAFIFRKRISHSTPLELGSSLLSSYTGEK